MSETQRINYQAFTPHGGGAGARIEATTTSSRVAIPGLEGGQQGPLTHVVITNPNSFSVFIRMGNSGVVATLNSFEIIAGSSQLLSPEFAGPAAMYMAAITETEDGYISVCAGYGS